MENDLLKTDKKIVVVAGGAGYLGGFIVKKLMAEGSLVIVIDRKKSVEFENQESFYFFEADMADWEAVKNISDKIKSDFNQVAAIIYAASAPLARQALLEQSQEAFAAQFSVNVFGAFNFFKAFCPILSAGGTIIGLTTKAINSEALPLTVGSYFSAKLALRGILKILSGELKNLARVYEVAPAFMPGGLNSDLPPAVVEFIKSKSKPEDIAKPEKVADLIWELISNKTSSFSGKTIVVPDRSLIDIG